MRSPIDVQPVPGLDAWARVSLDRLAGTPEVRRAGLALTEGGGRRLLFVASDRDDDAGVDWCHIDAYQDVPLTTVVRTGTAVAGSLDDLRGPYPQFAARQDPAVTRAIAAAPVAAAGQVLGGFVLFYGRPQRFDVEQRLALADLGGSLGAGLRRVQRTATRAVASLADEPLPEGARAATYTVLPDPGAVAPARAFVRGTLGAWDVEEDAVDAAVLCVSELVTNAIIHTGGGCEVRMVLDRGVLTTTVRDRGSALLPTAPDGDPLAVHGRGLRLVDALAARWGSELDTSGTSVWFALEPTAEPER